MQVLCDTDALITSDWQSIYIDKDRYLDEGPQSRLRFSLAHEMGHFILHKDIHDSLGIKDISDFYKLHEQIPQDQYGYFESQANKFANNLLVPREMLSVEKDKVLEQIKIPVPLKKIDKNTLNSYLAIPLSRVFGVSDKVIQIALNELNSTNTQSANPTACLK